MNAKQINESFDLVTYISAIVPLHKSGNYWTSVNGCPICGGKDRFQLKRTSSGDIWICRKCNPAPYHSSLDFLMEYLKVDFKTALQKAGGEVERPTPRNYQVKHEKPAEDWQVKAWDQVYAANARLLEQPEAEAGRRYLIARGISRASMFMFWLGFSVEYGRPCITIPYFDGANLDGGTITALKYRFIDPLARQEKGRRFSMLSGSKPYIFGLNQVYGGERNLLLVEGELNCVSIVQTRPQGLATLSTGSEGNGYADMLRKLARDYTHVYIWMDDLIRAAEMRARLGRDARVIKSPIIDNTKYDANEMLKRGLLIDFITAELATVCQGVPVVTDIAACMAAKAGESERAIR
jgi:hypothetical protein